MYSYMVRFIGTDEVFYVEANGRSHAVRLAKRLTKNPKAVFVLRWLLDE